VDVGAGVAVPARFARCYHTGMSPSPDPFCIFCKIAAGQIPCYKIYEDERVLAFLDVGPLALGHSLVVPKAHYARLEDMPPQEVGRCTEVVRRLAPGVLAAAGAADWNFLQNNGASAQQSVAHVHFHIIPRRDGDGLGYRWPAGKLDSAGAARLQAAIAERLKM
jgi:histidine triad (HIT) family protein